MQIAQGGTYSEVFGPIVDSAGALVTNAVSASDLSIVALVDSADADQSSGAVLTYAGGGLYRLTKSISASAALDGWGVSLLWDNGTDPAQRFGGGFRVITAAQADPAAYISASNVSVISPVAESGDITVYQGDDYKATESRTLPWSTTDAGTWPTLTGAAIAFVAQHTKKSSETITATGSAVTATGATKLVQVELDKDDTNAKLSGDYHYQVIATLSSGNVVTLAAGAMTVTRRLP